MSTEPAAAEPCSFKLEHYRVLLEAGIDAGYKFVSFEDARSKGTPVCILRHDVDYMPEFAVDLATVEQSLGIRSTFFFLSSALAYNLRATAAYEAAHAVNALGHAVGVHIDLGWRTPDVAAVPQRCREERELFRAITGIEPVDIVSFHNPHQLGDKVLGRTFPGVRNTYDPAFFSEMKYLSDSQGWYEGCACLIFRSRRYERIQLLTHPYIWPADSTDFIEDMARMVKRRADELTQYMVDNHPVCRRHEARFRAEIAKQWRA